MRAGAGVRGGLLEEVFSMVWLDVDPDPLI